GLRADGAHGHTVHARALVARLADLARVVRGEERTDHELARLDRRDRAADVLDDAHVFVAHRSRAVDWFDASVGPQVRTTHTRRRQANDRVGRLDDCWV